ncbi:MAG: hypothetical protein Q9225_006536 [Loekoesia sp. 1 TL-2023]
MARQITNIQEIKQEPKQEFVEEKPLMKLLEGPVSITVNVSDGIKTGTWMLPKDLLTHASPFFDAALNHPWPESKSKESAKMGSIRDAFLSVLIRCLLYTHGSWEINYHAHDSRISQEAYANTPPKSKLRCFIASILLDWITNKKYRFSEHDYWVKLMDKVEDLANDVVKIQIVKDKPFRMTNNWSDYLLVSSIEDFDCDD